MRRQPGFFPRCPSDEIVCVCAALEAYWSDKITADELLAVGKETRLANLKTMVAAGVDIIPSNSFTFYDHVLDFSHTFNVSAPEESLRQRPSTDPRRPTGHPRQVRLDRPLRPRPVLCHGSWAPEGRS